MNNRISQLNFHKFCSTRPGLGASALSGRVGQNCEHELVILAVLTCSELWQYILIYLPYKIDKGYTKSFANIHKFQNIQTSLDRKSVV